ncbi:hypothetical protein AB4142_15150 [Variovorax sp. 2RAF20]|uniref:hypothetical protein n=1 Tax=Variovorax sp. CF313 TaxID=1144315 RepID=UPI0005B28692|nr:hypothetical protein [Variovorax sp. CF313]
MISQYCVGLREHAALGWTRHAHRPSGWLLLGACLIDGRSIAADMLIARCTSDWSWTLDWSIWADHFLAFPVISLVMVVLCFFRSSRDERYSFATGLKRNLIMAAAMLPACAVASRLSSLFGPAWATSIYAATMVIVAICIADALEKALMAPRRLIASPISASRSRSGRRNALLRVDPNQSGARPSRCPETESRGAMAPRADAQAEPRQSQ